MRTLLTVVVVVVAVLASASASAWAQPPTAKAPTPGQFTRPPNVILYAGLTLRDPALRRELKTTPEQDSKLDRLVYDGPRALFEADRKELRSAAIKRQEEALAGVFSPTQMKRLRQVVCQHLARIPGGPPALAEDEEVSALLKLDDAQKKRMKAREKLADVLTPEQKKAWDTLVGKPYTARLLLSPVSSYSSALPYEFQVLFAEPMDAELKLTPRQLASLEAIAQRWSDENPDISWNAAAALQRQLTQDARAVLTEAQRKRLDQVLLQLRLRQRPAIGLYEDPRVALVLNLTAEQKAAQLRVVREHVTGGLTRLLNDRGDLGVLTTALQQRRDVLVRRLRMLLTTEQRAALKGVIGARIDLVVWNCYTPNLPWDRRDPLPPTRLVLRTVGTAQYAFNVGILTAEQLKQVQALKFPYRPAGGEDVDGLKARAKVVREQLLAVVKPEQLKRWQQLTLRSFAPYGQLNGFASLELLSCIDVCSALGLTEEQTRRLFRGAVLGVVLDEAQKKKYAELVGPDPIPPPSSPVVIRVGSPDWPQLLWWELWYVTNPQVQAALQLSTEKKKAFAELEKKVAGTYPRMTEPDFRKAAGKRLREVGDEVAKLLDEKQRRRLRQVVLNHVGGPYRGVRALFDLPEVVQELKITPTQVQRINDLSAREMRLMSLIDQLTFDPSNRWVKELMAARARLIEVTNERARDVLTETQKDGLKKMLGAEVVHGLNYWRGSQLVPR